MWVRCVSVNMLCIFVCHCLRISKCASIYTYRRVILHCSWIKSVWVSVCVNALLHFAQRSFGRSTIIRLIDTNLFTSASLLQELTSNWKNTNLEAKNLEILILYLGMLLKCRQKLNSFLTWRIRWIQWRQQRIWIIVKLNFGHVRPQIYKRYGFVEFHMYWE